MLPIKGPVEYELPAGEELRTIQEILEECSEASSLPADVGGPLRASRYLRGRNGNREEAIKFFQAMLAWRKHSPHCNADALRSHVAGLSLEDFQRRFAAKAERRYLPQAFLGRSRSGALVTYMKLGMYDLEGLATSLGESAYIRHEVEKFEWCFWFFDQCAREERRVVYNLIIADLEGATTRFFRPGIRQQIKTFAKVLTMAYLDAVEVTIIINAPWVFRQGWLLLSPLLSERQQAKMRVLGNTGADLEAVHATIAPEILPASLGGSAAPDLWGEAARQQKQSAAAEKPETGCCSLQCLDGCCLRFKPKAESKLAMSSGLIGLQAAAHPRRPMTSAAPAPEEGSLAAIDVFVILVTGILLVTPHLLLIPKLGLSVICAVWLATGRFRHLPAIVHHLW